MNEDLEQSIAEIKKQYPNIATDWADWRQLLEAKNREGDDNTRRRRASDIPVTRPALEAFENWKIAMAKKYKEEWKDIILTYEGMKANQRDNERLNESKSRRR